MSTEPAAVASATQEPKAFKEGLVLALWSVVVMLVVMNTTMFNVALPQVTADFALKATAASWVVTGYSIVFAISSITYSRLSDFLPIRTLMTIGLLCLGAGSLLGWFGHEFIWLMAARLLQAAGAAAAPGLGIVLVTRYIPMERRGRSMSTIISAASLGFGLGPVTGGGITQYLGWHWLFALFCHSTPYAIMFIYMPLSVAVTALSASVSNEMSRVLPKEQIGAGMGLSQLTQFFGGALGVALTGTALVWQKAIPLGEAFSHIFWGMAAVVAVSFLCYVRYAALRSAASSAKSPVQSA